MKKTEIVNKLSKQWLASTHSFLLRCFYDDARWVILCRDQMKSSNLSSSLFCSCTMLGNRLLSSPNVLSPHFPLLGLKTIDVATGVLRMIMNSCLLALSTIISVKKYITLQLTLLMLGIKGRSSGKRSRISCGNASRMQVFPPWTFRSVTITYGKQGERVFYFFFMK